MNIIDALRDPRLLGGVPAFRDLASWRAWLVFLAALYGLALSELEAVGVPEHEALALFCRHTGRSTYAPPAGGYPESVVIVGRQGAKTRIAATIVDFEAIRAQPEPDGTEMYAVLGAQDQRASLRTLFSYAAAPFDQVPALRRMVPSGWRTLWRHARRADSLTLQNGVRIAVYPCRPAAVRGLRARVVVLDELAFFRSSEGYATDAEMLRAARPCLATTGGKLIVLSSPYGQAGALYDLHRRHYGRDDSTTLVWQATAPEMNPTLSRDYLARMAEDDPEAYRSEVLGEFRQGVATFLAPDALAACVASGVRELAPTTGRSYVAFADPSGGRHDAFTLAIAHRDDGRAVLDVLRAWAPPFNPSGVIAEAAALLRRYRVARVEGDQYTAEFVVEQFRAHGITYVASERDRSALYLELLPLVNAGSVVLLDDVDLLRELRGLERRRGASGRDRIDHAPGAHDDRANAAAGALVMAHGDADGQGLLFTGASTADVSSLAARVDQLRADLGRRASTVATSAGRAVTTATSAITRTVARLRPAERTPEVVAARRAEADRLRRQRRVERDADLARRLHAHQRQREDDERAQQEQAARLRSEEMILRAIAEKGVFWPGDP